MASKSHLLIINEEIENNLLVFEEKAVIPKLNTIFPRTSLTSLMTFPVFSSAGMELFALVAEYLW